MGSVLPALLDKALTDAGFDLLDDAGAGWTCARISGGMQGVVMVFPEQGTTLLAVSEPNAVERVGLEPVVAPLPAGMGSMGRVRSAGDLYRTLRMLRTLQTHPSAQLLVRLEARLAKVPATERTREVRERIGQDVFREALMEFWGGRCALSGIALPPELLRASHFKPWADASDVERLDPFNGLLLAVRYDALFDKGLIALDDDGRLLISPRITVEVRQFVRLDEGMRLTLVAPGHLPYLRYHREHVVK